MLLNQTIQFLKEYRYTGIVYTCNIVQCYQTGINVPLS